MKPTFRIMYSVSLQRFDGSEPTSEEIRIIADSMEDAVQYANLYGESLGCLFEIHRVARLQEVIVGFDTSDVGDKTVEQVIVLEPPIAPAFTPFCRDRYSESDDENLWGV